MNDNVDLFGYKHRDIKIKKDNDIFIINKERIDDTTSQVEKEDEYKENVKNKLDNLISKNEQLSNIMKNEIANSTMEGLNDFFDKTLIDSLNTFHTFLKKFIPGLPPYYKKNEDGSIEVSMQAYIDAKDFLLNEFGVNTQNLAEEIDYNGNLNTEQMHFALDYSVSNNGNIYKRNNLIFNCTNKNKIYVDYIDFAKGVIKFKPGVFIQIDKILNQDKLYDEIINKNDNIVDKNVDIIDFTRPITPDDFDENNNGNEDIDKNSDELKNEIKKDVTLEDLEDIAGKNNIDSLEILKKLIIDVRNFPDGIQTCNTNKVNYLWLLFLIIIGGGTEGQSPFPQDCSVCGYYNKPQRKAIGMGGKNSTAGKYGKPRNYRTGHNRLYNNRNRQGLKIGLVQMLHKFLEPFFDINISPLEFSVAKAHIKLLPSVDIGAFIEHCLLRFQEWISKEIRNMQGCDSQYIIPKLKETEEGIFFDGMEELNSNGRNTNDIEMYFRRNFAILYNYTHYHSKYSDYSEDEKRDEMIRLYNTLKMSREKGMSKYTIEQYIKDGIHISFSDIVLDYHTNKAADSIEYGYVSRIKPGSTTKIFAAKAMVDVNVDVDPSNINKIIELGLFASYNCDSFDKLDLFEPDYSDSTFQPIFN